MPIAIRALGFAAVTGLALFGLTAPAQAGVTYQLLTESRADAPAGQDVGLLSYPTLGAVSSGAFASGGFTQIDLSPDYKVVGLTHDAGGYRLLTETRTDAAAGVEVGLLTYATLGDLQNGTFSSGGFTQIDLSPDYEVAGLAWDGSAYRLLTESRADAPAGQDVGLLTYATLADLMSGSFSTGGFTQIDLSPDYRVAGFTWDGSAYRLLTESRADAAAGVDVGLLTYTTLADVMSGSFSTGGFTQIDLSPDYQVASFAATITSDGVPEPATWALMLLGFGGLGAAMRGRRRQAPA